MAGNDVFLYLVPSDVDVDDVRLRDPFNADNGGIVSGILTGSANITGAFVSAVGAAGTLNGSISVVGNFASSSGVTGTFNSPIVIQASFSATSGQVGTVLGVVSISSTFAGAHGEAGTFSGAVNVTGTFSGQHFAAVFGGLSAAIQPLGSFLATFTPTIVANDNTPFIPIFARRRSRR
jgi:hypothetical protein